MHSCDLDGPLLDGPLLDEPLLVGPLVDEPLLAGLLLDCVWNKMQRPVDWWRLDGHG